MSYIKDKSEVFSKGKKGLRELLEYYNDNVMAIPVDDLVNDWESGNSYITSLTDTWEKSLHTGSPDYSVYADNKYLNEAYISWTNYSREYCKRLRKWLPEHSDEINPNDISSVLDLGCGIAYTTIALSDIFPNAVVFGTNEPCTPQLEFDKLITAPFDNINIVGNFEAGEHIDVIFASEFFEHIDAPIDFLEKLIRTYSPNYIIFANTFGKMATGHFHTYNVNGEAIEGKNMSRKFSKYLKLNGYGPVKTGFFNNRPYIYKKNANI